MFQLKWLVLDIFLPIFRREITNFLRAPQEDNKKSCKNIYPWYAVTSNPRKIKRLVARSRSKHKKNAVTSNPEEK